MQSLLSHTLLFLLLVAAAGAATYRPYLDCAAAPFTCGNLSISVSYPFRLYNRLDYCGFPGFILTCTDHNSTMMINIGDYEYQVKSVDYLNHLLTVVDIDLTAQSCPRPYKNTTLDLSLYMYTDRNQNLTVFINCTTSPETALYDIKCLSEVTGLLRSYYALDNESLPAGLSASCNSTVVVPVDRTAVSLMVNSMLGFGEGLREGFTVRWLPGKGWCRDCKNSGGICGYKHSSPDGQTCYCPYGLDLHTCSSGGQASSHVVEIVVPILGVFLLGLLLYYLRWRSKRRHDRRRVELEGFRLQSSKDLPFIDLAIIQAATGNFSDANKLGEGGFGPVYKGTLHGGREIAVKRLSTKSKQGAVEFKNEVSLIAKLQHKNLVRMLGYCVEREEKLLIYEYLPNRSLDVILFDPTERSQLDWRRRHHIVAGIARGILYLHEDSLLKVIHRDLKASNVLLDKEMNPKISDFGMARIFEADENEATNTNRVVGTYGYMAPEYAMDGVFSVKSDVYSFGVLLLEILSGQKNGRSHFEQHGRSLLRSAWQLWSEGRAMQLVDPLLGDSYPASEALKLIHIGLLCVQENAEERPTMSSIVLMLQSEQKVPQPTQPPTFFRQKNASGSVSDLSSSSMKTYSTNSHSINNVTNSVLAPR